MLVCWGGCCPGNVGFKATLAYLGPCSDPQVTRSDQVTYPHAQAQACEQDPRPGTEGRASVEGKSWVQARIN